MQTIPSIRPQLALVVIARNEARCIARCLNSARAWVDKIVVLDTGSSDDTMAIAQACGAEVHQAVWTDDFSAARNTALALADADWHLVLDADEWIDSGADCLREAVHADAIGIVCIRNDFNLGEAVAHSNSWIPRLLPRGVHYAGRIHEQPVSTLPRHRLPLIIGHDGYTDAHNEKKKGRNRTLLQQALHEFPEDDYLHYQLGKDHEIYGEYDVACAHYLNAKAKISPTASYHHDLVIRTLHCLSQAGRLDEAILQAESQFSEWEKSPDFFFILGNLMLDCAVRDPGQAQSRWLPMAEAAWLRCLEIGERPELEGSVAGRGSYLARHNLAVIHQEVTSPQLPE